MKCGVTHHTGCECWETGRNEKIAALEARIKELEEELKRTKPYDWGPEHAESRKRLDELESKIAKKWEQTMRRAQEGK